MFIFDFNSQPREGGWAVGSTTLTQAIDFNSQPREGGWVLNLKFFMLVAVFQLTAARRRLATPLDSTQGNALDFNSQPREGGWASQIHFFGYIGYFNSQPREGGWTIFKMPFGF